jgi:hypothetical protein
MGIKAARKTLTLGDLRCGDRCHLGNIIKARITGPTLPMVRRRNMAPDNNTEPQVTKPETARIDETQRYTYAQNS